MEHAPMQHDREQDADAGSLAATAEGPPSTGAAVTASAGLPRSEERLPFPDLPRSAAPPPGDVPDTVAAHEAKGLRRPAGTIWRRNPGTRA
jgi:hypothetical protein